MGFGSVVSPPGLSAAISTCDQLADQSKFLGRSVDDQYFGCFFILHKGLSVG